MNKEKTNTIKDKLKIFKETSETTKYAFLLVWNQEKGKTFILIKGIMAILNALFPLVSVIIPGLIINELAGNRDLSRLIFYIAALVGVPVLSGLLNIFFNRILYKISLKISLSLEQIFFDRALSMDYETVENPNIQIQKDRAQDGLNGIITVVETLSGLLWSVIGLLAISSIILTLNPIIIFLIIAGIIINSIVAKQTNQNKHKIDQEITCLDYHRGAYCYMMEHISYAKEIRLFDIKNLIIGLYSKIQTKVNVLGVKYRDENHKLSFCQIITNLIQQLILYSYLVYEVLFNNLPIGNMTIYISSAGQFSGSLSAVFNSYIGLVDRGQKTRELMDFFSIPLRNQTLGNKIPEFNDNSILEFKNVSFKYPGNERYVIKNMNIKIKADETLCIVGANGSGKSTFVKLLLRLYTPSEGEILLNGININEYDYKKYQRLFAPVFQDYNTYSMTLGENIILASEYDKEKLDKICEDNGLSSLVSQLPKRYNTIIGKWLDPEGIDPSGGEGQRIAIARACYHGGSVFILDEPTAAIDPITEYEIYTQFNKIIKGNCAILITHRLAAAQLADKIAVFDDGRIIEYGTHDELYNSGKMYTEMFDKQAYFYREKAKNVSDV